MVLLAPSLSCGWCCFSLLLLLLLLLLLCGIVCLLLLWVVLFPLYPVWVVLLSLPPSLGCCCSPPAVLVGGVVFFRLLGVVLPSPFYFKFEATVNTPTTSNRLKINDKKVQVKWSLLSPSFFGVGVARTFTSLHLGRAAAWLPSSGGLLRPPWGGVAFLLSRLGVLPSSSSLGWRSRSLFSE